MWRIGLAFAVACGNSSPATKPPAPGPEDLAPSPDERRVPAPPRDAEVPHMALVIEVVADGTFQVAGKPFDEASLRQLLDAAYRRDANTQIVIHSSGDDHAKVVHVMELAKAAGLVHLAISTRP